MTDTMVTQTAAAPSALATDVATAASIGSALLPLLPLLGIPAVGPLVTGLVAAATVAPEAIALLQGDIALFQSGTLTAAQLTAKFAATQSAFEAAAKRWKTAT